MNKTSNRPNVRTAGSAQNVPFGVLGIMLPYKIVRSTHFSNLCVGKFHFCFSFKININKKKTFIFSGQNGYGHMLYHRWKWIYYVYQSTWRTRSNSKQKCCLVNSRLIAGIFSIQGRYWKVYWRIRRTVNARFNCEEDFLWVKTFCWSKRTFEWRERFIFRIKMVDFQGVCLQRALRVERSAGGLFRGVCKIKYSLVRRSHSLNSF